MTELWLDTRGDGYELFRTPKGDRYLFHHRILAWAWGLIEDLDDDMEVDHYLEIPWLNVEWNLRAMTKGEHSVRTRRREKIRKWQLTQLSDWGIE